MLRLAWQSLRTHARRALLTVLAVTLGGGMLGGSIIYGDTAKAAFFDDLARGAAGVDVSAIPTGHPARAGQAALAAVSAVPGVAHVDGRVSARLSLLDRRGRVITNAAAPGFAISLPTWPGFAFSRLVAGRLPNRPGEAGLDAATAARQQWTTGEVVQALDPAGHPHALTVVGLIDLGVTPDYADSSVVALTAPDLAALADNPPFAQLVVAATPGTDEETLATRVAAALGAGYEVRTGTDLRHEIAVQSGKYVDGFLATLAATSMVALVVAALVVYNTFQILVAQRAREHALLRCIGASRGQLVRLVIAESGLVGLVAAVLSLGVSVAAGQALIIGQNTLGRGLPDYQLSVSPLALVATAVIALLITVASALVPSVTAGRVSPLAALRVATDQLTAPGHRMARLIGSLLAGALAVVGLVVLNSGRHRGFDGLTRMVGGAMVVFIALVIVLPLVVTRLTSPLRWLLGRGFGLVGRLAVDNARRHPVRFSATMTAVMVGIAPLTTFAVILTTAQVQAGRELAENFPVDFVLSHADNVNGRQPIDPALVDRLRATPELGAVTLSRVAYTGADGCCSPVGAVEPGALGSRVSPDVSDGALDGLPPGTVAVHDAFASDHHLRLGDTISLGEAGHTWSARVVAFYDDLAVPADVLANWVDLTDHVTGDDYVLMTRASTVTGAAAAAAVDAAIVGDPVAVITSVADRRDSLAESLGRRLTQFDVLLGVSMVIALLGITNSLALSVLERRRESATLRALGLTRRQLLEMMLAEAMLTSLAGAIIGVAFGVGFGWVSAHELLLSYGHGSPTIPVGLIAGYVGLASLAGVAASLLPARGAARRSVIDAIADT